MRANHFRVCLVVLSVFAVSYGNAIAADPEGFWKFDDSANLGLNSGTKGAAWDLTSNGTPTYATPGAPDGASPTGCVALDKSGQDYLSLVGGLSSVQSPHVVTTVTVAAWVKPTTWADTFFNGSIINTSSYDGTNEQGLNLSVGGSGAVNFEVGKTDVGWAGATSATGVAALDVWQHIAGTYDGSYVRVYRNGVLLVETPCTTGQVESDCIWGDAKAGVGKNTFVNAMASYFDGQIDDLRYYENVVLTQAEIAAIVSGTAEGEGEGEGEPLPPSQGSPSGWWKFDASGDLGLNSGTKGAALDMQVPLWVPSFTTPGAPNAVGQDGDSCLDFLAGEDVGAGSQWNFLYKVGGLSPLGSGVTTVTAAAWINADTWTQWYFQGGIISTASYNDEGSGHERGINLVVGEGGKVGFEIGKSDIGFAAAVSDAGVLSLGEWHHVAGTYDGHALKAYVDGELVAETPCTTGVVTSNCVFGAGAATIGKNTFLDTYFDGRIDDVRYYENIVLSQNEIQRIAAAGWFAPGVPVAGTIGLAILAGVFTFGGGAVLPCVRGFINGTS